MPQSERAAKARRRRISRAWQPLVLLVLSLISIAARTSFDAPPRFDGAGYAVLAESLLRGEGYRAIDHPDRPPHAHYPPGYPFLLSALWRLTGTSARAAHLLSLICTTIAVWLTYHWARRRAGASFAFIVGLALALNWSWGRAGGGIQSEPMFFLLTGLALNVLDWALRGSWSRGVVLGGCLAATILTRHVGAMIALALLVELVARRRPGLALSCGAAAAILVAPWAVWVGRVRVGAQHELIGRGNLLALVGRQLRFYVERIPDQITGPVVEVGTVFRPELAGLVRTWAVIATGVILVGWLWESCRGRWRVAAMVPGATLALLLVWPFTEAGRFLLPLVPFVLLGAAHGIGWLAHRLGLPPRRAGRFGALLVLGLSIPYSAYAFVSSRQHESERAHRAFDEACGWVAWQSGRRPVLVRQSGEAFWLMGRTRPAFFPRAEATSDEIARLIEAYDVEFLILDAARYANAAENSLDRYVQDHAPDSERVFSSGGVSVYRVPER
jgi:hypothetical protein